MRTVIDSDVMRQRSSELKQRHAALMEAMQQARQTVDAVCAETEGQGTQAFCDRWLQEEPAIKRACDCVEEFGRAADQIAQIMDETQNSIASAMRG